MCFMLVVGCLLLVMTLLDLNNFATQLREILLVQDVKAAGLWYVSLSRINEGRGLILISVGHNMIQIRLYEYSYL